MVILRKTWRAVTVAVIAAMLIKIRIVSRKSLIIDILEIEMNLKIVRFQ